MSDQAVIKLENVSFTYDSEGQTGAGVRNLNLTSQKGEVIVLCGKSGCGKTTVTRLLNGLIPHYYEGQLEGKIKVCDQEVSTQPLYDTARICGSVFQNPRSQFFNVDTTSEVTFGCENLGMPEEEIRKRLKKTTADFHMEKLLGRNVFMLSGGEKQKIACAGVSIMEPEVLILDEPSSNLDVNSVMELGKILKSWKEQEKTIVISEHRLYYLKDLADRFLYMEEGQIQQDYTREEFIALGGQKRKELGLRCMSLEEVPKRSCELPAGKNSHKAGEQKTMRGYEQIQEKVEEISDKQMPGRRLGLEQFHFAHKHQPETLHIHDREIPGEGIVAIIGDNGAGKSTFSRCFCGLAKKCGTLWEIEEGQKKRKLKPKDRLRECYTVMQDVNHQLFTESVLEEVLISMEEENEEKAEKILDKLDLLPLKDRHPMSLSGGQKQRVAIASAIASGRRYLFFDEPTSGLDLLHMEETAQVLRELAKEQVTTYVITHDPELILECCTAVIHMEDGDLQEIYAMDEAGTRKLRNYFMKQG